MSRGGWGVACWRSWWAGVGRPARRQRRLVTLRCAGRDRRTVSGREVPRTRVASLVSHRTSRGFSGRVAPAARPAPAVRSGQAAAASSVAQRLVGHGGPEEAGELAGDGGGGDGRALAVVGEVAVAVVQADLGLPGARGTAGGTSSASAPVRRGSAWWVLVVPGGLDQQPAGVAVAGLGEMAAVLLVAGGVLATVSPRKLISSRAEPKRRKSPISASSPSAVRSRRCRGSAHSHAHRVAPRLGWRDLLELVRRARPAGRRARRGGASMCSSARCASGSSSRWRRTHAMCCLVQDFLPSRKIAAVAQQLLGDPMARGGARAAQVIAAADQVAQALLLGRRRPRRSISSPAR